MLAIRTRWMENRKELSLYKISTRDHSPSQTHPWWIENYYFCWETCLQMSFPEWRAFPLLLQPSLLQLCTSPVTPGGREQREGQLTNLRISHSKFWMQSSFLLRQRWAAMRFLLRRRTSWMNSNCSEVSLCILIIIWKSFLGRSVIWSTGKGSLTWNQE